MKNVRATPGEKIVQAKHVMAAVEQPLAQVRTNKPGPAGH
jgi:hypothetical protein